MAKARYPLKVRGERSGPRDRSRAPLSPPRTNEASSLGKGKPLDPAERSDFEPRFGFSLDKIRIHAGPAAPSVIRRQPHGEPDAGPPMTALEATGLVSVEQANLYDSPKRKPGVLKTLAKDTVVSVTHEGGNYYRVVVDKTVGFMKRTEVWLPADPGPEKKPKPRPSTANPYQKIIDQALTTLTSDDGEKFYHLDAAFGFKLVRWARDTSKPLPPGTGSNEGWLRTKFDKLFKQVGAKPGGPQFYALVTHQGNHLLARTAHHKHTVLPGGKVKKGDFPDALEAFWVHTDWEERVAAGESKK